MNNSFIIDTQLPPRLAKFLNSKDLDAIHTTFFPDGHLLQDSEIIQIAINESRIIITKDSDFLDYYLLKGIPPKILLLQFGNIKNQELIDLFNENLTTIQNMFHQGAELVQFTKTELIDY